MSSLEPSETDEMNAWGEVIGASWRRSLKFYERRVAALRALEDDGLLSGFRIRGEEEAGGRLGDPFHEISLTPTGVTGMLHLPGGDRSRLQRAMDLVFDVLQPDGFTSAHWAGRFLVPIDGDYEKVRRATVRTLLGGSLQFPISDWSILVDLDGARENLTGQCEFGIVARPEMRERVAGNVGRLSGERIGIPDNVDFPEVALFLDQTWGQAATFLEGNFRQGLDAFWSDARSQAATLTQEVIAGIGVSLMDEGGDEE